MVSDLTDACNLLARKLPQAHRYLAECDTDGTTTHGKPGSKPPWNPQAANAALDAHEGARRLEASLRMGVTGRPGQRRGGSDANTLRALREITRLEGGIQVKHEYRDDGSPCECTYCRAVRLVFRWVSAIDYLPAVDKAEPPREVDSACPYCGFEMMRVYHRSGRVACLRIGICQDSDGNTPKGRMEYDRYGVPCITWNDGLVT